MVQPETVSAPGDSVATETHQPDCDGNQIPERNQPRVFQNLTVLQDTAAYQQGNRKTKK